MNTETEGNRPAQTGPDDLALIRRYSQDRDSEAMAELFQRHSDLAYRTALRVLRDPSEAQDAVQSAFVRIMRSLPAYRGGEGVRSWMMKIVMNTARDMIKRAVRRRNREEETAKEGPEAESARADSGFELTGLVKDLLDRLPERYRLPIWLHHYEGMPFAEVAEVLEAPENTVRSHANRGLDELRLRLARSGMAVPSVSILGVLTAIPAEGAPAALLNSLSDIVHGIGQFSPAVLAAKAAAAGQTTFAAGTWLKIAIGVAAVATSVGVAHVVVKDRDSRPPPSPGSSAVIPPASGEATQRILYQCDFNSPEIPAVFKVKVGSWHYVPGGGPDGSGCMEIDPKNFALTLDVPIESLPVVVSYVGAAGQTSPPTDDYMTIFGWDSVIGESAQVEGLSAVLRETPRGEESLGVWRVRREYVTESWIDRWIDGNRRHSLEIETPGPTSRLTLYARGRHRLDNLVVRMISPEELPGVQKCRDAVAKIPSAKRVGKVMLPELNPPDGSRQAFVRFLPGK